MITVPEIVVGIIRCVLRKTHWRRTNGNWEGVVLWNGRRYSATKKKQGLVESQLISDIIDAVAASLQQPELALAQTS